MGVATDLKSDDLTTFSPSLPSRQGERERSHDNRERGVCLQPGHHVLHRQGAVHQPEHAAGDVEPAVDARRHGGAVHHPRGDGTAPGRDGGRERRHAGRPLR